MPTITAGSSITVTASVAGQTVIVSSNGGATWSASINGGAARHYGPLPERLAIGPMEFGSTAVITAVSGDLCVEYGDASPGTFGEANFQSTVSGGIPTRRPSITFVGHSWCAQVTDTSKLSFISYLRCMGAGKVDVYRRSAAQWSFATSGATSQQIIDAGLHTLAAAAPVDYVGVMALMNDLPASSSDALAAIARHKTIIDAIIAGGKQPILILDPPRGNGTTNGTATNRRYMEQVVLSLSQWCRTNNIRVLDAHTPMTDRATGNFRGDCSADYVHASEAMHWWIAQQLLGIMGINWNSDHYQFPMTTAKSGNPNMQFSGATLTGWTANACTPSEHTNDIITGGKSALLTGSTVNWQHVTRTDTSYVAGDYIIAAMFEVLSSQTVLSLYTSGYFYGDDSKQYSLVNVGSENSSLAAATPRRSLAPGKYLVWDDLTLPVSGNLSITTGFQGDAVVVHYSGVFAKQ